MSTRSYAWDTEVPIERSQAEVQSLLRKFGCGDVFTGFVDGQGVLAFKLRDRGFQIRVPMPDRSEFALTPTKRRREPAAIDREWEQAIKARWRVYALYVKAVLEADRAGVTSIEEALLAHVVLPGGGTVGQQALPMIAQAYETGRVVPLLTVGKDGDR